MAYNNLYGLLFKASLADSADDTSFFFFFLLHKLFEEAPLGWKMWSLSLHLLHPSDHMLPEQVLFFSLQLGVAGHGGDSCLWAFCQILIL